MSSVTLERNRRRPPTGTGAGGSDLSLRRDLQSLLTSAVQRLGATTRCESVVAWALREDGSPYVASAVFDRAPPPPPDARAFEALALLRGATDLAASELPAPVRELEERYGCRAAVPICSSEGRPLAALLLGGTSEALGGTGRGPVRPRTLAALQTAGRRLAGPLSAALAAGRLSLLDEEVRRLDRLAALGAVSAEIAHEIRNPLASVKTFVQLLPEQGDDPEFLTSYLEVVTDEILRMERLLGAVLAHAQPTSETSTPESDAVRVLAAVVELLRHRARDREVTLDFEAESDLPRAAVSEDRLRQVVLNLALNAIDATPTGGAVLLRGRAAGSSLELIVADQGPGISPDLRSRVFEPFFTSRSDRPGGLGLAISRRIAEEAGGSIQIADGATGGAEFRVLLPRV